MKKKILLYLLCPLLLASCNAVNQTSVTSNTSINEEESSSNAKEVKQICIREKMLNDDMSVETFMDTLFGESFTASDFNFSLHVYEKKEENDKLLYEDDIQFISINSKSKDHHNLKDMTKPYLNYYKRNCVSNVPYNYSENVEQIHLEQNSIALLIDTLQGKFNQYYYLNGKCKIDSYTVKTGSQREYSQDKNFLVTYTNDIQTDYYTKYVIGPMNESYTYKNFNLEIYKDIFKVSYDIESMQYDGSIELSIDRGGNIKTLTQKSIYRTLDDSGNVICTRILNRELVALRNSAKTINKYKNFIINSAK